MKNLKLNKKADIKSVVVILLILAGASLIVWFVFSNTFKGVSIFDSLIKRFKAPELQQTNSFNFIAQAIDTEKDINTYSTNGKSCSKKSEANYVCPIGVQIGFKVVVKNTGSDIRDIYARPRIGLNCNNKAECGEETWLRSRSVCLPVPGEIAECTTSGYYFFDKKGTYKIYPGAECLVEDCPSDDPTTKAIYSFNKDQWITIVVS